MGFEIRDQLGEAQWKSIESAALQILEKTGLAVEHDEVLCVLGGKAGVRVDRQRVRLDPKLVHEQASSVRGTQDYDTHLICGAYCHNYLDPDTGETRALIADRIAKCQELAASPERMKVLSEAEQKLVRDNLTAVAAAMKIDDLPWVWHLLTRGSFYDAMQKMEGLK